MSVIDWKSYWESHVEKVHDDPFSQVGRTQNSVPMSEKMFSLIARHFLELLELNRAQKVLDFCCGNGLLAAYFSKYVREVVGVDFNQKLVDDLRAVDADNITGIVSDGLEIDFEQETFDRIIFAAAIQHFSESQVVLLFKRFYQWLKPGGKLLVTDITDRQAMWQFYNSSQRRTKYFDETLEGTSPMGTWFDRDWLKYLGESTKYSSVMIYDQPVEYWYSHYRFDLLADK